MTTSSDSPKPVGTLFDTLFARRAEGAIAVRTAAEALEQAVHALNAAVTADGDIGGLAGQLQEIVNADQQRLQDEIRAALQALHTLRQDLETTREDLEHQRAATAKAEATVRDLQRALEAEALKLREASGEARQLQTQIAVKEAEFSETEAALRRALDESAQLRAALGGERQRAEGAERDLAGARQEIAGLQDKLCAAEELAAREVAARAAADAEIRDMCAKFDGVIADLDHLGAQLEASLAERAKLLAELGHARSALDSVRLQKEVHSAQARAQAAKGLPAPGRHSVADGNTAELPPESRTVSPAGSGGSPPLPPGGSSPPAAEEGTPEAAAVNMPATIPAFDAATTVPDLLRALMQQLTELFTRVAVFRVRGNRLGGECQAGFDYSTNVRRLFIPLSVDSMLTRVANTRAVERLTAAEVSDETRGAPFRGKPALAVGIPLVVQGHTVAVVYADDAAHGGEPQKPAEYDRRVSRAIRTVHHAAHSMERLSEELINLNELREYGVTLLASAEEMYLADLKAGKATEVRNRLRANLECARQLYRDRALLVGAEVADDPLDEQIAALLQSRVDDPFARELAALVGSPYAAAPRADAGDDSPAGEPAASGAATL